MKSARILVLGDMGCSPRMKNHCLSFANSKWKVYFSGYLQSSLPQNIIENENIIIDPIKESPCFLNDRKKNPFFLMLKVLFTALYLLCFLFKCDKTDVVVIQNPPAVPTFIIVWLVSKFRRFQIIIDWHNYGYTLMSGNSESFLTRLYKHVELTFSRKRLKAKHFCVSKAFENDLFLKWNIKANVLYDLPWEIEPKRDLNSFHDLFQKLGTDYPAFLLDEAAGNKTVFTEKSANNDIAYLPNRPALVVSSCSWTVDDDFDTLFKALDKYNSKVLAQTELPNIICVITGKGPMKQYFERIVAEQQWRHVSIVMPWLEIEDYPTMLSAADIGICLHKSTSGLDLPMKIVDMFSVALPVLALNYKCLHELVRDRVNGRLFSSSDGLLNHLLDLLPSIRYQDNEDSDIEKYRHNIIHNSKHGLWQSHWNQVVLPVAVGLTQEQ